MKTLTGLFLGCLAAFAPLQAQAQDYPAKTVTIVVPFAAGGTTDLLARVLAERLSQRLKGTFIVENKAGAGGNVGVASVAKATPDGYTLTMGTVSRRSRSSPRCQTCCWCTPACRPKTCRNSWNS